MFIATHVLLIVLVIALLVSAYVSINESFRDVDTMCYGNNELRQRHLIFQSMSPTHNKEIITQAFCEGSKPVMVDYREKKKFGGSSAKLSAKARAKTLRQQAKMERDHKAFEATRLQKGSLSHVVKGNAETHLGHPHTGKRTILHKLRDLEAEIKALKEQLKNRRS